MGRSPPGSGHFWRTASISSLIDILSPTATPPPSIGMLMSMPDVAPADLRGRGKASPLSAVLWMVCSSQQYDDATRRNVRLRAYPFADVVGRTPAACRQLASSALPGGAGIPVTRGLRSLQSQSAVGVMELESVCADYCHARFSLRWMV